MSLLAQNSTTAVRTNVPSTTSTVTLLAANTARKGFIAYNSGTGTMYISFGAVAGSSTDYSVPVATLSSYQSFVDYTGPITVTWSAANGAALVTEFS